MIRFIILFLGLVLSPVVYANVDSSARGDAALMQQFDQEEEIAPERAISNQRKHEILFLMGAGLLILLLLTAGFGLAMGIWEKDVFTWHMLSAGLTLTLAIVHAVVSFVWFYPD